MKVHEIAKVCHDANRSYCELLGDYSQTRWEDAPMNIRETTKDCVEQFLLDPDMTPEKSHENWMKAKIADGWIYGKDKDAGKKTHPSLIPYDQLSGAEQRKDFLFHAIVKALSTAMHNID